MEKINVTLHSHVDGLALKTTITKDETVEKQRAIVIMVHGMCEHKERYMPFCEYLSSEGYICAVYDQRGHGEDAYNSGNLGYYNGLGSNEYLLADDLQAVVTYMKQTYPNLPVYLFGHSMGSLVARMYFAKYGKQIYKLVLCGIPTYNGLAPIAMKMVWVMKKLKGDKYVSEMVKNMSTGNFSKGLEHEYGWISYNTENLASYSADKLCGFTFTLDAYYNLFSMLYSVYSSKDVKNINRDAAMLIIAGEDDPVIESQFKFLKTVSFYKHLGVRKVVNKLFPHMRHEILKEDGKEEVYKLIVDFFKGLI